MVIIAVDVCKHTAPGVFRACSDDTDVGTFAGDLCVDTTHIAKACIVRARMIVIAVDGRVKTATGIVRTHADGTGVVIWTQHLFVYADRSIDAEIFRAYVFVIAVYGLIHTRSDVCRASSNNARVVALASNAIVATTIGRVTPIHCTAVAILAVFLHCYTATGIDRAHTLCTCVQLVTFAENSLMQTGRAIDAYVSSANVIVIAVDPFVHASSGIDRTYTGDTWVVVTLASDLLVKTCRSTDACVSGATIFVFAVDPFVHAASGVVGAHAGDTVIICRTLDLIMDAATSRIAPVTGAHVLISTVEWHPEASPLRRVTDAQRALVVSECRRSITADATAAFSLNVNAANRGSDIIRTLVMVIALSVGRNAQSSKLF